jgi:hypothetical protein
MKGEDGRDDEKIKPNTLLLNIGPDIYVTVELFR